MKSTFKFVLILALLAAVVVAAAPAQAATGGTACVVDPGSGPVGTVFNISCSGFTPNTTLFVYAVEPDGRTSALNIYGFFPTGIKSNGDGVASLNFVTEIRGFSSVPPGDYTFVIEQKAPGNTNAVEAHATVHVQSSPRPLIGATLKAALVDANTVTKDITYEVTGSGYLPGDGVNIWVTQPPATMCSGLGIDQLTLGALAGNGSSLWTAPGAVTADGDGNIDFFITFRASACRNVHVVSARSPRSGIGGEVGILVQGFSVRESNAFLTVSPNPVPSFNSLHTITGSGFPAGAGVNCWYTRPDGRVLFFINVDAQANGAGEFSVVNRLDDFPPFTSTEPGPWTVTCATANRSALAIAEFMVVALVTDP